VRRPQLAERLLPNARAVEASWERDQQLADAIADPQ
jgi:hypothetical protein